MNFDSSDEQKMLRDEARKFLSAKCPSERVRAVMDNPANRYDRALWQGLIEQGWLGVAIPEQFGGLGLSRLELCVLAEELGRAAAPVPFASTAYCLTEALLLAGDAAQQEEHLPRIASGSVIGALATSEAPGTMMPASPRSSVKAGHLSGEKLPVIDGSIADLCLVLAEEGGAPGLFLVDLNGEGVHRQTLPTLDPSRDAAQLCFDNAPAQRLGAAGSGLALLHQLLDRAAVLFAFEQCGVADRALEMARNYALERYAFGRVIGSYQAIKHKLADMYINNELARANAYYGAWALNTAAPELPVAASAARIAACEAAWFATKENIQTHGGVGFTWAYDCHLYYRRARHLGLAVGAPRVWKQRLLDHLEQRSAA